jgi:hypothetical protein
LPNSNEKGYRWIWQGTSWTQDSSQTLPQQNGRFDLQSRNPNIYGRILTRTQAQDATNNHARFVEIIPQGPQGQTPLIKYNTKLYT